MSWRHSELGDGVSEKRRGDALRAPADEPRAERHAADEHDEHDRLRIGRVPDEELEVVRPDRFVDQAAHARNDEHDLQYREPRAARLAIGHRRYG